MPRRRVPALVALLFALMTGHPAGAGDPPPSAKGDPAAVARQVDATLAAEVFAASGITPAPQCDDATFVRRVWLDLVGDIPTPEHVIAFTLDASADKRVRVVRELLAEPQYGVNWARYW